jgi:hypothetical protein
MVQAFFDVAGNHFFTGWMIATETVFACQHYVINSLSTDSTGWFAGITHFRYTIMLSELAEYQFFFTANNNFEQ